MRAQLKVDEPSVAYNLLITNKNGSFLAKRAIFLPRAGLEPARVYTQGILSPHRLPFRHPGDGGNLKTNHGNRQARLCLLQIEDDYSQPCDRDRQSLSSTSNSAADRIYTLDGGVI